MEPKLNVPVYKHIFLALLSGIILLAAVVSIFILAKRQDKSLYNNNSISINSPAAAGLPTQSIRDPDSEVRGVWIATVDNINFPSKPGLTADVLKAELDDIIATTLAAKLNAIYFQVRPTSDAFYSSSYFPLSAYLVNSQNDGFPQGFDPFAYLIAAAHKVDIKVHAWVNPLRITAGSADKPAIDTSALGAANPARRHPEWTVPYADGRLYYNAGIPAVQNLIARGVAEIVMKYNVDGVIFDDYFYPYPVTGAEFDDAAAYKTYGVSFSNKDDWRRDNVNKMVKACYDAIKNVNTGCAFGIAPFGVWQNDDGTNGGSDTGGFNSYTQIYCDALAWIKGGYIDYIAPQIYWQFSTSVARFDVLCRWWNAQCIGTGVDLLITHGVYRSAEWGSSTEILQQVEFARSEDAYKGSIHFGYAAIKANVQNLNGQLQTLYNDNIIYSDIMPDGSPVVISTPENGSKMNLDSTYILGTSDPGYPLYLDGKPVSQTKKGYFSIFKALKEGENKFTFTQNGIDTVYTIFNKTNNNTVPAKVWATMDSFKIKGLIPSNDYMLADGESISLQATAPSGATVTAMLGGVPVTLKQTTSPPDNNVYMEAVYSALYTLPAVPDGQIKYLGVITYKATRGSETANVTGAGVKVRSASYACAVEVIKDDSELKVATDSWYYDDFTPAVIGMHDNAVRLADGYYKLSMGGYIRADDVKVITGKISASAWITSADVLVKDNMTKLYIKATENVPLNGFIKDGKFVVTLYNVSTDVKNVKLGDNPLFTAASAGKGPQDKSFRIYLTLVDTANFYGFEFTYKDGYIIVSFRNPSKLAGGELPLAGRTIIVDAGHGGKETGAYGPSVENVEKVINLKIALNLASRLEAYGAKVILTRSDDSTVLINDRLELLDEVEPDMSIAIHLNSMGMSSDITKIRGLLGLYFSDAGKLLTGCVSASTAKALNRMERTPAVQRFAMVRNPKFPSVLIEVGFMTSAEEYNVMTGDAGILKSSAGIAEGVLDFYRAQEKFIK